MRVIRDPLTRAWIGLLCLGGASALVAALAPAGTSSAVVGGVILVLALLKSRLILSRYLGLWQAPGWLSGFNLVLTLYALLLLGLYLVPAFAR